jgi:hypothetical protein
MDLEASAGDFDRLVRGRALAHESFAPPLDDTTAAGLRRPHRLPPPHKGLLGSRNSCTVLSGRATRTRIADCGDMGRSERRSRGVLLVLLTVVLVNDDATQISFLGLDFTMPKGVAKLFSAVAGVFVMALIGGVRIHRIGPTFDKRRR